MLEIRTESVPQVPGTVTINIFEYRALLKDSAILQVLERFVKDSEYISKKDLMILIDIEEEKEGEE